MRRFPGKLAALACAVLFMAMAWGPAAPPAGAEQAEKKAPAATDDPFGAAADAQSPSAEERQKQQREEMEKRMQEALKQWQEELRAAAEARRSDPAWAPSHEEVAVLRVVEESNPTSLNSFCLDAAGNILACCGGIRWEYVQEGDSLKIKTIAQACEIRVLSPEGKLLATWPLEFTPQAITADTQGTILVAGDGRLARLTPDGKADLVVEAPWLAPVQPAPESQPPAEQEQGEEPAGGKQAQAASKPTLRVWGALARAFLGVPADEQEQEESQPEAVKLFEADEALMKAQEDLRKAQQEMLQRRRREFTSISVAGNDVFVVCGSETGYAIYRTDRNFGEAKKIVDRLRGCCGQMDIRARNGEVFVAENGRHRVVRYDREGNELASWGRADRKAADGFGGCCEPKNLCFAPDGDLYASESGQPESVKRFTPDGKFVGVVALPEFSGGCVRMTMAVNPDGTRLYVLNAARQTIHVFADKRALPTHQYAGSLGLGEGAERLPLQTVTMGADGNVLAGCGGPQTRYVKVGDKYEMQVDPRPGEIRVLRPDGSLVATWKVDFTPRALAAGKDGTVFVGGDGRLAKLDAGGKVLLAVDAPNLADFMPAEQAEKKDGPGTQAPDESQRAALLAAARMRALVSGIAVADQDLFVVARASTGFAVYRMDHSFGNAAKIVDGLRGCCGQMDIQTCDGDLYVAENGRFRVARFDRDGNLLGEFGQGARGGLEGFGSCCNPMNVRFGPGGELFTSESNVGRVKRYTRDGKLLGVVGVVPVPSGCKHVPLAISADGSRVYVADVGKSEIAILERIPPGNEKPVEEKPAGNAAAGQ